VFPLIGYRPDEALLRGAGVEISPQLIPNFHPETFQTNVPGLYVAGSVMCGCETWSIFIENGRAHATPIIRDIVRSL
jgi:thioredoxin reductase (NADPH)